MKWTILDLFCRILHLATRKRRYLCTANHKPDLMNSTKRLLAILCVAICLTANAYTVTEQLATAHEQCVADTLSKERQKWYNRDEMLTAFAAYDAAVADADNEAKAQEAISLLTAAHKQFEAITTAYTSLRAEAIALYTDTYKSKFALRDSVKQIRTNIISYYSKNEDHYAWVCEALPSMRTLADLFGWYKRMSKVTSVARNQLRATDYEGKASFRAALSEAWQMQITATTQEAFEQGIASVKKAEREYLATRPSEWVTIQNGKLWKTTTGAAVQAHAPGFVRVGDIWYMVGEDRTKQWNPDVNLYSSTDLVRWKFERKIIQNGVTTKELGSSRMIERPKLMYNARTDKFVVWCHYEKGDYSASEAACFECDSVNGAYEYVWSGRPLDIKSRDCNVFQDTDGTAYFISTTDENHHLGLFRLSDDYHGAVQHTQLFAWQGREAPAVVKIGQRYFMFSSACSGWDPNQCKLSYSTNLRSGWSDLKNVGNSIAFDTQAAAILAIKGTKKTTYLYVGDRWQDPGLTESKTIIFPIEFNGTTCEFKYHERFDINFVTGEWRETPTDDLFADKTGWTLVDCSSQETSSENGRAANAIDGNVGTKWHTKYSNSGASAPHHITIDMGRDRTIKGFLATPRMDGSTNGLIRKYTFEVSADGETWQTASKGDWLPYCTEVTFSRRTARFFRLTAIEGTYASLAEIDILIDKAAETPVQAVRAEPATNGTIVAKRYFTLSGQQLSDPANCGLYIEQLCYADGRMSSTKRMNR